MSKTPTTLIIMDGFGVWDERAGNAIAAARAFDANAYATLSDGSHMVSFDKVVEVMNETGHALPSLYRETSEGGLAKRFKR